MGNAVIFSGGYAKLLAANGLKFKDDTLILTGSIDPSVTNPSAADGSIYLSDTYGIFLRENGAWRNVSKEKFNPNYITQETFEETKVSDLDVTYSNVDITSNTEINGAKSLVADHDLVGFFEKSVIVFNKFRNRNVTVTLWAKSDASAGNVTITFKDASNAGATIVASQPIQLGTVPTKSTFTFNVPENCSELAYRLDFLSEAGKMTYIDDVEIFLTEFTLANTSVTVPKSDIEQSSSLSQNVVVGSATITGALTTNNNTGVFTYDSVSGVYTVQKKARFNISVSMRSSGAAATLPLIRINGVDTGASSTSPLASYWTSTSWVGELEVGQSFLVQNAGNSSDFQRIYVSARTSPATETKTIPLTSSVLVTEPDTSIRVQGASVASAKRYWTFTNVKESLGDKIQYIKDAINGDKWVALKSGTYTFSASVGGQHNGTQTALIYLVKNLDVVDSVADPSFSDKVLAQSDYHGVGVTGNPDVELSWTGYLSEGDFLKLANPVASTAYTSYNAARNVMQMSYQGSVKILNPSSDQKVEIPTHELRFEGASSRGSVATAIVKFDTLAKIKGDGFEVVNTAADGTVIKVKKGGLLNVSASVSLSAAGNGLWITKNQAILNSSPVTSEILDTAIPSTNAYSVTSAISGHPVKAGDMIRVASSGALSPSSYNMLHASLQEQSVAVALQNVAPRWDDSDSAVRVKTGNGFGSQTGYTQVRRFSNVVDNLGSSVQYSPSSTLGDSFAINENGLYDISYTEESAGGANNFAIVKNDSTPTVAGILALSRATTASVYVTVTTQAYLIKGDVIRACVNDAGATSSASPYVHFSISKVGKTQGTVDVTPFVQVPQNEVEAIEALTDVSTFGSTNTGVPVLNITKNTNKGIIQVISNSVDGTSFKALKDCELKITGSARFTTNGGAVITKNSTLYTVGSYNNEVSIITNITNNGTRMVLGCNISLAAGDIVRFQREAAVSNFSGVTLTATALSPAIATPTDQVSSDTMNFVFKPTAITDNDPVGTFNTFNYASGGNTPTINGTAPTQTPAEMNANGIKIFARPFNVSSIATQPARVDVKIGKGLKSKEVLAYLNTGKSNPINYDLLPKGTFTELYGTEIRYSETTGILSINAAENGSAVTLRTVGMTEAYTGQSSGYFVFNASKSPSLVSIPNMQQRVAYLSDVKPNGTNGGTPVVGWQTRTLNTLVDSTGFVVSLSGNAFTLPAGTYRIRAMSPSYGSNTVKSRIYSVTKGATALVGTSGFTGSSDSVQTWSYVTGELVLTGQETFRLDHNVSVSQANVGLGFASGGAGEVEVFANVEITKIK